ncbi:MAG: M48 family metallopeptidase [Paenibacillaceae bacterium]|nr:M48 family metallopeptidase [Paenibacillaceae bacterium]
MKRHPVRRLVWWCVAYAAVMAAYLWLFRAPAIPAAYKGTVADPATFMTADQLRMSNTYAAERNWLFFISYGWEWGVYAALLFSGAARRWESRLAAIIRQPILRFPVYGAIVLFVAFATYLPFRFVGYRLALHYGVSAQSFVSWLQDKFVGFAVDSVVTLAVAGTAIWFIGRGGRWWLKLWLLSVPFIAFMMYIQPVVIDPLYNKFTPIADSALEQRILAMAAEAGIPAERVYEADMSNKTNSLNAYVNGIGSSLRIVLWDTTLQRLTQPEILLIVAHEIGHYVKHHLEWSALGAAGSSLFLLWAGSFLLRYSVRRWGALWGLQEPKGAALLPLLLLIVSLLGFVSLPVSNAVSRQAEHAADVYSMQLLGDNEAAITMQQKLAISSLDEARPPLLVYWFRYTHPPMMERIDYVANYKPSAG